MDSSIQYLGIDKRTCLRKLGRKEQIHKIEVAQKGEQCHNMFFERMREVRCREARYDGHVADVVIDGVLTQLMRHQLGCGQEAHVETRLEGQWKNWARKHNVDELNDDVWFWVVKNFIFTKGTTIWAKKACSHSEVVSCPNGAVTQKTFVSSD